MTEQKSKTGKRKTKMEILKTIKDFFLQSERVVFNRSAMREPPWSIDPRTAEEFFRIIHFCQRELPPLRIIEGGRDFIVQALVPPTVLTIREALEVMQSRTITEEQLAHVAGHKGWVADGQKEVEATEAYPKLESSEAYWGNSRVHPRFKCEECDSIIPFPWHCFEPMDINEDNKLQCYRCMTIQEIPRCKCGKQMKMEFVDRYERRVRAKK